MLKRLTVACVFTVYSMFLINLLVFKNLPEIRVGRMMFRFGGTQTGQANFIPFKTILPYLLGEKGWLIAGLNLGGNIALLLPIGMFIGFHFPKMSWKTSIALAVGIGLILEGLQVVFRVGIFDIDDVILNALGVILGYWIYKKFVSIFNK